jgi:DNA-binding transcriptional ArsR family regulator
VSAPSTVFAALGDPTRLEILGLVGAGRETTATRLAGLAGVSRPAVVKHLGVLERAGLVDRRKQGRDVHFRVATSAVSDAASWLDARAEAWADRLAALKAHAESDEQRRRAGETDG